MACASVVPYASQYSRLMGWRLVCSGGAFFVRSRPLMSTRFILLTSVQSQFENTSTLACEAHPSSYGAAIRPNARRCLNFHLPLILT